MRGPSRPILRYHGGKWMLAPWIISHFPGHRVYVEPFCGAGSVLLRKRRSRVEVVNDLDDEVVNLLRILRSPEQATELRRRLELTPYSRTEFFAAYEVAEEPLERARRLIVRAAMAFGTYRSMRRARKGFRANPWCRGGSTGVAEFVSYVDAIDAFTDRLRAVCIECRPATDIIQQQDAPDVLFYCDPPYPHEARTAVQRPSDGVYAVEMSDDDHRRLADVLHAAQGFVVLSGYRCGLYEELFDDWRAVERETMGDGGAIGGVHRTEVLWLNPAAWDALEPPLFERAGGAT